MSNVPVKPMNLLNPDVKKDGKTKALVILSKTTSQKTGPLKEVKFSDHSKAIREKSSITPTCVRVQLEFNGQLYGYEVEIPEGHEIDKNNTEIRPKSDVIEIEIVKRDDFKLKRLD